MISRKTTLGGVARPGEILLRRQICPECGRIFTGMGLGVAAAGAAWIVCSAECVKAVIRAPRPGVRPD